jgi:hypothetical protein
MDSSDIAGGEMAAGQTSLRSKIEKLVGTTRGDSMRVRQVARSRVGNTRCVCIVIEWPTGSFSLFFFRHADGNWRPFPPEQRRPEMGMTLRAA